MPKWKSASPFNTYARDGTSNQGPCIRLAEAIAQQWRNILFGIRALSSNEHESQVQAFARDVETNTRREVPFMVSHVRYSRKGTTRLEDPHDVYELVANQGIRRLRACILAIIPGDVIESAVMQRQATPQSQIEVTPKGIQKFIPAFEPFGVSKAQIENFSQCRADTIKPAQIVRVRTIYSNLRDGMSSPGEWFDPEEKEARATRQADIEGQAQAASHR